MGQHHSGPFVRSRLNTHDRYFKLKHTSSVRSSEVCQLQHFKISVTEKQTQVMYPHSFQRLLILYVWLLIFESYACKKFKATRFLNGTVACATNEPTKVVPLNQLYPYSKCSESATVSGMQCAWHCTQDDNCTNYNYRADLGMCEIFHDTPSKVSFIPKCYHFQVCIAGLDFALSSTLVTIFAV